MMILRQWLGVAGDHQSEMNHLRSPHNAEANIFILESLASDHLESHRAPEGFREWLPHVGNNKRQLFPWNLTDKPP